MAIDLAAATYLGLALAAQEAGDTARVVECLASIDEDSWTALEKRFPGFPSSAIDGSALTAAGERTAALPSGR